MTITLLIKYLIASGPALGLGQCSTVPVAKDVLVARAECIDRFRSAEALDPNGRRIEVEEIGSNYPARDLAVFLLRRPLSRAVLITKFSDFDQLEIGSELPEGKVVELNATRFRLDSASPPNFLFLGGSLAGVLLTDGSYARISSNAEWLRLKIGGD